MKERDLSQLGFKLGDFSLIPDKQGGLTVMIFVAVCHVANTLGATGKTQGVERLLNMCQVLDRDGQVAPLLMMRLG